MKIVINKREIIIKEVHKFQERLIGLMGKKKITYGLLFNKCTSIHTFFMKSCIDVIMLDNENKILYFLSNVKPNRIIIKKGAKKVLELPPNTINNLHINDYLDLF